MDFKTTHPNSVESVGYYTHSSITTHIRSILKFCAYVQQVTGRRYVTRWRRHTCACSLRVCAQLLAVVFFTLGVVVLLSSVSCGVFLLFVLPLVVGWGWYVSAPGSELRCLTLALVVDVNVVVVVVVVIALVLSIFI